MSKQEDIKKAREANHLSRKRKLGKMVQIDTDGEMISLNLRIGEGETLAEVWCSTFYNHYAGAMADDFRGEAHAVCDPADAFDGKVGVLLATGRAFVALGNKMIRRAEGIIKHKADMEEQRKLQAARPRKVVEDTEKDVA
jgi:hypothetical protein